VYAAAGLLAVAHIRSIDSEFLAWGAPRVGVTPGDHLQAAYDLWLPGHQLEHGDAPWRDPYSFQPEADPRTNFAGWPFGIVFWPLHALLGTVGAWNVFVVLTYVGAGALAALWLRALGLSRVVSIAGGLAFALAPYRSAQTAGGHLLAPISMLLPLALYGIEARRVWLAAAALVSIPLAGQLHLALGVIPFFAAYAFVRRRAAAGLTAAATAVATGIAVYLVGIRGTTGASGRSFAQVERYSAEPLDLVTRHVRHGLESFVFVGWLLPAAAIAGLVVVWTRDRSLAWLLGLGAAIPILLALGGHTPLYEPLWHVVPGLRHSRVPERLLPIACLTLAALAAYAVSAVRWRYAAVVALALVPLDLRVAAYTPLGSDEHNRVYATLQNLPSGRLLERPVYLPDRQEGSLYLYYVMQAPNERPLGYSTTAPAIADVVARRLRRGDAREFHALGVRYVVRFEDGVPTRLSTGS
jgi:hypothetical protein